MNCTIPWVSGNKIFICLFLKKMYRQIIPISLSLLLRASLLQSQLDSNHGKTWPKFVSVKVRLYSFAVL